MKRYFAFFITLFFILSSYGQSVFNADLIKKIYNTTNDEKVNVLVLTKAKTELNVDAITDVFVHYKTGNIYSITTSIASIKTLSKQPNVVRIESINPRLQLMADTCVVRNRIKEIKQGLYPLAQPYDGSGVIVGIIDSGTDFTHPDFKDANGNTRIKYLWDMTKPLAINTPTMFGYGQEWNSTQIDQGQCTHSDLANSGHGTASSGISAGNGLSTNHYEGMAPKADIIVVALDFGRPGFTITDAVQYLVTKAQQLNKPIVINASVGEYYGSHDGTDLQAQMINNIIANVPGRAMVASCGNGGAIPFHVGYTIINTDTNFTWIRNNDPQIGFSEYADTNDIKNVKYSVGVNNSGGYINLGNIGFKPYNYALNSLKRDTIYHNQQRIGIIESVANINPFGVYELDVTIRADSLNYFWRIEHTGIGKIDSWNFDYVSSGLPTAAVLPQIVNYKKPDTTQTLVSSFQCSDEVITVANYVNRNQYQDVNNITRIRTETPGKIAASSSRGPTRDNRIKPDIAASGATILTSAAMGMLPNLITNIPQVVALGGFHITAGGTSASSPVVAGFVALYLQKHPTATNRQIKQAIINCAYNDVFTTISLPNHRWGYGKLDGFSAMSCGEPPPTNIRVIENQNTISLFPNPLTNEATVLFDNNEFKKIKLYNASGQLVFSEECSSKTYLIKKNNLCNGIYMLVCEEKTTIRKTKIVVL